MQRSKYGAGGCVVPATDTKRPSGESAGWVGPVSYLLGMLTIIIIEGIVRGI